MGIWWALWGFAVLCGEGWGGGGGRIFGLTLVEFCGSLVGFEWGFSWTRVSLGGVLGGLCGFRGALRDIVWLIGALRFASLLYDFVGILRGVGWASRVFGSVL